MRVYSNSSHSYFVWKVMPVMSMKGMKTSWARRVRCQSCTCTMYKTTVKRNQMQQECTREVIMQAFDFPHCLIPKIRPFRLLQSLYHHFCMLLRSVLKSLPSIGLLLLMLWKFYYYLLNFVLYILYTLGFSMSLTSAQCSNATLNGYFLTHRSGK